MLPYKQIKITALFFGLIFLTLFLSAKDLEIISFNDFHGRLIEETFASGKDVGMEKFVSAIKDQIKSVNGNAILVAGGDNYQGSAITVLTKGAPVSDIMKELGVAASAVGNHEFDWGIDSFKKWQQDGNFPFLAANIINKKTAKPVTWAKPYLIIEKNGVKVAFIGLATVETPYVTAKKNIENLEFTDGVKAAQKWIDFLKNGKAKEGNPDVIIALTHIPSYQEKPGDKITGDEINELCKKTKGLNAVISAHSHKIVCGYIDSVAVVQAYSNGRSLGILNIELNDNNKLEKITPSILQIFKDKANIKKDAEASKILKKYMEEMKKIDVPIGKAEGNLTKNENGGSISEIGAWVTKAMTEQTGTQIAITNSGGLRTGLNKGDIKITDMYGLMPFDNQIMTMKLSGKDLKRVIEHSIDGTGEFYGLIVHYDSSKPKGNQVVSMDLLNGKPIEMDNYYTVSTLDFAYNGGDKFDFKGAKDIKDTEETLRDLLIKEVKEEKQIQPVKLDYLINVAEQKKAA